MKSISISEKDNDMPPLVLKYQLDSETLTVIQKIIYCLQSDKNGQYYMELGVCIRTYVVRTYI